MIVSLSFLSAVARDRLKNRGGYPLDGRRRGGNKLLVCVLAGLGILGWLGRDLEKRRTGLVLLLGDAVANLRADA